MMISVVFATMLAINSASALPIEHSTNANVIQAIQSDSVPGLVQIAARERKLGKRKKRGRDRSTREDDEVTTENDWQQEADLPPLEEDPPLVEEPFADGDSNDLACDTANIYDPANFDNVLEDFEQTSTLHLSGPEWDNTLVRNCRIHDTGSDGIVLKNVRNVVIHNCEVWNTEDNGIKTSSSGSTENVVIDGNYIHDIDSQAIHSPQRSAIGVDHPGLKVLNNIVENVTSHGIYIQSQDALIEGNTVRGTRKSNGISVRSSGVVRCNMVSGRQINPDKAGIRYFSDHQAGISNTVVIERNTVQTQYKGIHIAPMADRYDGQPPPHHVVENFVIRWNNVEARDPIVVSPDYDDPEFGVQIYDNQGSFR